MERKTSRTCNWRNETRSTRSIRFCSRVSKLEQRVLYHEATIKRLSVTRMTRSASQVSFQTLMNTEGETIHDERMKKLIESRVRWDHKEARENESNCVTNKESKPKTENGRTFGAVNQAKRKPSREWERATEIPYLYRSARI